ncbi:MAG: AEC family transporter [Candidatus Hadarchaeales archaeon]
MEIAKLALVPVLLLAGMLIRVILKGAGWRYLQSFIIYVTYPLLMFTEMVRMNLELLSLANVVMVSVAYMILCFLISTLTSRGLERRGRGTVIFNSTFFNSMFLPFPIIYAFYGDLSIALVFSLPFMITHNTLGIYLAARYGGRGAKSAMIESLTFPPIVAFVLGILCRPLLSGAMSSPIFTALNSTGTLTVYLSLILAGLMIPVSAETIRLRKRVPLLITINRLVISPVTCVLLILLLGLDGLFKNTLIVMSIMPTAFTNVIIASKFGLDVEGTVQSLLLPTIISLSLAFLLRFSGVL